MQSVCLRRSITSIVLRVSISPYETKWITYTSPAWNTFAETLGGQKVQRYFNLLFWRFCQHRLCVLQNQILSGLLHHIAWYLQSASSPLLCTRYPNLDQKPRLSHAIDRCCFLLKVIFLPYDQACIGIQLCIRCHCHQYRYEYIGYCFRWCLIHLELFWSYYGKQ